MPCLRTAPRMAAVLATRRDPLAVVAHREIEAPRTPISPAASATSSGVRTIAGGGIGSTLSFDAPLTWPRLPVPARDCTASAAIVDRPEEMTPVIAPSIPDASVNTTQVTRARTVKSLCRALSGCYQSPVKEPPPPAPTPPETTPTVIHPADSASPAAAQPGSGRSRRLLASPFSAGVC